MAIRWTETYVKYLDYITVDIKHDAPHRQRNLSANMIFMRSDDPNPNAGLLWKKEDYKTSTSALMCLQQEEGNGVPHIPIQMTTKFGMAQPELADLLLDTDFILFFVMVTKLDMVEFSTLGKFSTVARQQTIHVHTSISKLMADEYCCNCCPSCPEFSNFFAVLHTHQPCSFFV